jgi:hypothetical protein
MTDDPVSKLEQRAWTAIVGFIILLGGWWLQNQYDTTIRIQEQISQHMRFVEDRYVQKDYLTQIENRLGRIEGKIDDLRDIDKPQYPYLEPYFNDKKGGK